jgi:hypothetical protein
MPGDKEQAAREKLEAYTLACHKEHRQEMEMLKAKFMTLQAQLDDARSRIVAQGVLINAATMHIKPLAALFDGARHDTWHSTPSAPVSRLTLPSA